MHNYQQPQAKVLGEGVTKYVDGALFVKTVKHGEIEVPPVATRLNYSGKIFRPKAELKILYSAQYDGNRYRATSVVHPEDLKTVVGKLTLLDNQTKYGHVTPIKPQLNSKVFVPFSARSNGQPWHGNGAELQKVYTLRIFRQEEAHGCKYVAWSIVEDRSPQNLSSQHMDKATVSTMTKLAQPTAVLRQSDHQSVEFVKEHCGIIYEITDEGVISVTSPTCQNTYFPASLYEEWMRPGRFIQFDGRRVSDNKISKLMGSNPVDLGAIYPYAVLPPLTLFVPAVVNKVSTLKAAWAWNDHVGRIYIPWMAMDKHMQSKLAPFSTVHLEIGYNGKHDDIPWVASNASLCGEEEAASTLTENAQMLKTEDGWKVQTITEPTGNASIFLVKYDENRKITAFAKDVDLNGGLPPLHSLVRVTHYTQERHGRHALRAVLVTALDSNDKPKHSHLVHIGSRRKHCPPLYEQPTQKKEVVVEQAPQKPPPPPKSCWNLAKLGTPKNTSTSSHLANEFPAVNESMEKKEAVKAAPAIPAMVPINNIPSFSEEQDRLRPVSVWSGTPVEAKPESMFFNASSYPSYTSTSTQNSSSYFSTAGDQFICNGFAPIQCSSAIVAGPTSDLRNTQSESSSPGLKLDEAAETNMWSSLEPTTSGYGNSFQFGFPTMELPIFQRLAPGNEAPVDDSKPLATTSCPCEIEKMLSELWTNPNFIKAFASTDPATFQKVQEKLNSSPHTTRNAF